MTKKRPAGPSKGCKVFCETTYMNVQEQKLPITNPVVRKLHRETCEQIYCNPGCRCQTFPVNSKETVVVCPTSRKVVPTAAADKLATKARPDFVPSVSRARKARLQSRGVQSVCRDLPKELPKQYSRETL